MSDSLRHRIPVRSRIATGICFSLLFIAITPADASPIQAAFSRINPDLSSEQQLDAQIGRRLFRRPWISAPASTQAVDGLGPLYNARACIHCHPHNGRGRIPATQEKPLSLVMRLRQPANKPDPEYGYQLQPFAIAGHQSEGYIAISYENIPVQFDDGAQVNLRKPSYRINSLSYGPLNPQTEYSPRLAPALIAPGMLASIPASEIEIQADPQDNNGDGVSGEVSWVWSREQQQKIPGRFGHKAEIATLSEQVQHAFTMDMGLSTPLFPQHAGDCTQAQELCLSAPHGDSPQYDNLEIHQPLVNLIAHYLRHLTPPLPRQPDDPDVLAGKTLFTQIGCASCHRPSWRLGEQSIQPYTDLLLHDMGESLSDGNAEWRTAPLWGIGLTEQVNGNTYYLHDGRALSLMEAILWHGGEAQPQRDAVLALDATQRDQLIRFIQSL